MKKRILLFSLVVIVLSGCGGRDTSTSPKALLGHWVNHGANRDTHYYIDSEKLTMVDGSRRVDMTYHVLVVNVEENWISIRVKTEHGVGHDKRLRFSSDRRSLISTIKHYEEQEYSIPSKWIYVDDKRKPD